MKRAIFGIIIFTLIFSFSFECFSVGPSSILINGEFAEIPDDMGSIKAFSDRTFVPVRFVLEYFAYDVSWDDEDDVVFGRSRNGDVFVMQVGSPVLLFREKNMQSKKITMDVTPLLIAEEGRTYVPIRFLAEAIGYKVGYDNLTGTVMLDK